MEMTHLDKKQLQGHPFCMEQEFWRKAQEEKNEFDEQ